jgi:hypothetical protein
VISIDRLRQSEKKTQHLAPTSAGGHGLPARGKPAPGLARRGTRGLALASTGKGRHQIAES